MRLQRIAKNQRHGAGQEVDGIAPRPRGAVRELNVIRTVIDRCQIIRQLPAAGNDIEALIDLGNDSSRLATNYNTRKAQTRTNKLDGCRQLPILRRLPDDRIVAVLDHRISVRANREGVPQARRERI